MIEKLDTFGCTIITEEGENVNVLNDKVALQMFEKINELVEEANESQKRDKQVREAIEWIGHQDSRDNGVNYGAFEKKLNQILNSTKE